MRNWHPTRRSQKKTHDAGPELLVKPLPGSSESLGAPRRRFPSPTLNRVRHSSLTHTTATTTDENDKEELNLKPYSIPLDDIVVVDVRGGPVTSEPIFITTFSHGYFEFSFLSHNAHDVLLAFLTKGLPNERIAHTAVQSRDCEDDNDNSFGGDCSFDIDDLTATRMRERIRTEPWSEKMRRRMLRIADRLEELSSSVADCACVCGPTNTSSPTRTDAMQDTRGRDNPEERRQSPPRNSLEVEDSCADLGRETLPLTLSMEPSEHGNIR